MVPVIDRHGQIYAGVGLFPRGRKSRGSLVCVDGNSHKIRWERTAAGAVESTPAIGDDDAIYFGDNAGVIHAVDFLGNVLWTAAVGSPAECRDDFCPRPRRFRPGQPDAYRFAVFVPRPGDLRLAEVWRRLGATRKPMTERFTSASPSCGPERLGKSPP